MKTCGSRRVRTGHIPCGMQIAMESMDLSMTSRARVIGHSKTRYLGPQMVLSLIDRNAVVELLHKFY